MPAKISKSKVDFPYAIKSFIGYLEGTHKSAHTIKSYRLDVSAFRNFLTEEYPGQQPKLDGLSQDDLERYREYLKSRGFKTNTRRRKILTVTQFLNYLAKRKKVAPEVAGKQPAPHKVERIPFTVSSVELIETIRKLPSDLLLEARNRALLWTLAETGCLVSEVTAVRYEDWQESPGPSGAVNYLRIRGKFQRTVPVSQELFKVIQELKNKSTKEAPWVFLGFNKFGALGGPITVRGIELLVRAYGKKLGCEDLTPRSFRHSIILHWFQQGLPQNEIQLRLGLKTTYAFRSYIPLLNRT